MDEEEVEVEDKGIVRKWSVMQWIDENGCQGERDGKELKIRKLENVVLRYGGVEEEREEWRGKRERLTKDYRRKLKKASAV